MPGRKSSCLMKAPRISISSPKTTNPPEKAACRMPAPLVRSRSGQVSCNSEVPTPHSAPMPTPVRNRVRARICQLGASALVPAKMLYSRSADHGPPPSEAIAEDAANHPADGPAEQRDRNQIGDDPRQRAQLIGRQKLMQRRADREQQGEGLVAVEQPEEHGNSEHAPLPAREAFGVRSRCRMSPFSRSCLLGNPRWRRDFARPSRRSTRGERSERDIGQSLDDSNSLRPRRTAHVAPRKAQWS